MSNMVLNCRMAYGRLIFKFKPYSDEEWSITMKHKDAMSNGIIESVTKDDSDVDYGASITFSESFDIEKGSIRTFRHSNVLTTKDCRLIWSQLKELGFKPTAETYRAMKKRGIH